MAAFSQEVSRSMVGGPMNSGNAKLSATARLLRQSKQADEMIEAVHSPVTSINNL
jgi:hypothetical protein